MVLSTENKTGFTLTEISMVLVIIGLLVGGILTGQYLIRAAELRGDISAVEKFETAINTFRVKYGCLPGDCLNASDYFPGAVNGNGNGLIEGNVFYYSPSTQDPGGYFFNYELARALDHLARANLIPLSSFDTTNSSLLVENVTPSLPSGGHFIVRPECVFNPSLGCMNTGSHTYRLGVHSNLGNPPYTISTDPGIYTVADAFSLDTKFDDGDPMHGRITIAGSNSSDVDTFEPASLLLDASGNCTLRYASGNPGVNGTTCQYDITLQGKIVGLFVHASF